MNDVGFADEDGLSAIDAALAEGLAPGKVNKEVKKGPNDGQIEPLARALQARYGTAVVLRFIEYMDVGTTNGWQLDDVLPSRQVLRRLSDIGPLSPLAPTVEGETAQRWRFDATGQEIGLISSVTQAFCGSCNRARLSTDGRLYLCLFASRGHDLRALLRGGAGDAEIANAIDHVLGRPRRPLRRRCARPRPTRAASRRRPPIAASRCATSAVDGGRLRARAGQRRDDHRPRARSRRTRPAHGGRRQGPAALWRPAARGPRHRAPRAAGQRDPGPARTATSTSTHRWRPACSSMPPTTSPAPLAGSSSAGLRAATHAVARGGAVRRCRCCRPISSRDSPTRWAPPRRAPRARSSRARSTARRAAASSPSAASSRRRSRTRARARARRRPAQSRAVDLDACDRRALRPRERRSRGRELQYAGRPSRLISPPPCLRAPTARPCWPACRPARCPGRPRGP